jgi:flagellar basal body-associated protein FliL
MRTVFEDTNEALTPDTPKSGQSLPILLWAVAILFLVGAFAVYRFVSNRIVLPPPPAIAVNDPKQVNELLYKFNQLIKEGNFDQAQAMLSADAQKRLTDSQKTFRETLLAQRKGKDEKVIEAVPLTENIVALTDNSVTIGVTYYFDKNETIYIPLTVIKETIGDSQRLAIADWEEKQEETKTESAAASPSPEAKKSESPTSEKK